MMRSPCERCGLPVTGPAGWYPPVGTLPPGHSPIRWIVIFLSFKEG